MKDTDQDPEQSLALERTLISAPWLHQLQEQLAGQIKQNLAPHAILIDGAPGWGQSQLACWLAAQLLGMPTEPTPTELRELAHPDFRWLEPDGVEIKIDQVRSLNAFAQGTAADATSGTKVAIVDQAHALNPNAANALLKTLEEPTPGTFLVLTTGYTSRLLPTIHSRCQRYSIHPDLAALDAWVNTETATGLAKLSTEERQQLIYECGSAPETLMERSGRALYPVFNAALGQTDRAKVLEALLALEPTTVILSWLRHVTAEVGQPGQFPALRDVSPRRLLGFSDELIAAQRQLLASNSAIPRLQLERLLLRWKALTAPS